MINPNNLINLMFSYVRANAPYDTGNLHDTGFYGPYVLSKEPYFVIGGDSAPYGVLLNNEPTLRGNTNVHYQWIYNNVMNAINMSGAVVVNAKEE